MRALPLVFLAFSACSAPEPIEFPMRLAHLEELRAPLPEGPGFPEVLEIVDGGDSDLWWSHARGFVQAPVADVWAQLQRPEVGLNYREIDDWTVTLDTEPDFDVSFTVHITVNDIVTIEYDNTWVQELQAQDEAKNPTQVAIQWNKTDGSPFIALLAGSIVLASANDGAFTEIQFVHHMRAAQRDQDTLSQYLRDMHANIIAAVNNQEVPAFTF